MNKVSVTYRAVGSAALKPEYTFKQNASTPIISFDRLAYSDPHRKLPLKTRLLKTSSETYIRSVAGASLVMLVLILVGA